MMELLYDAGHVLLINPAIIGKLLVHVEEQLTQSKEINPVINVLQEEHVEIQELYLATLTNTLMKQLQLVLCAQLATHALTTSKTNSNVLQVLTIPQLEIYIAKYAPSELTQATEQLHAQIAQLAAIAHLQNLLQSLALMELSQLQILCIALHVMMGIFVQD